MRPVQTQMFSNPMQDVTNSNIGYCNKHTIFDSSDQFPSTNFMPSHHSALHARSEPPNFDFDCEQLLGPASPLDFNFDWLTSTSSSYPNQILIVAKDPREALLQSSFPLATIVAFS